MRVRVYVRVRVNRDSVPNYDTDTVKVTARGADAAGRQRAGAAGRGPGVDPSAYAAEDPDEQFLGAQGPSAPASSSSSGGGGGRRIRFNAVTAMEGVSLFDRVTIQLRERRHLIGDLTLAEVDFPCYPFRSERRWYVSLPMRSASSAASSSSSSSDADRARARSRSRSRSRSRRREAREAGERANGEVYFRVEWCKRDDEMEAQTNVRVTLPSIGITLTEHNTSKPSRELVHCRLTGVGCRFSSSASLESLSLDVQDVQVDNQLITAHNMVILAPTFVNHDGASAVTVAYVRKPDDRLANYQYFSILIQELDFVLEEELLSAVIRFMLRLPTQDLQLGGASGGGASGSSGGLLGAAPGSALGFLGSRVDYRRVNLDSNFNDPKLYFELLHIHPIKINLNVFLGPSILQQENEVNRTLGSVIAGFGLSMIDVQRAPLKVNSLAISNALISQTALQKQIAKYYTYQLLAGFHRILGSVELRGSPIALINNLGTGVLDFFYEPAKGFIHGPEDFARGVAAGTMSLLKSSVYGVFNSVGQMTGSVGKSLAMLSMDDNYKIKYKKTGTDENLLRHAQDLGLTIFEAITGIVRNPLVGAERDGLKGFVRGVASGIAGAALKPTSAALEFASKTVSTFGTHIRFLGEDRTVVRRARLQDPRYYGITRSMPTE